MSGPGVQQQEAREGDGPNVHDLVIADIEERRAFGRAKYGVPLRVRNGRDPLVDAYQEALDLACYLRQEIERRAMAERGGAQ